MSLADKVVVVTGAARGMGCEYVRGFRNASARVVATDLSWAPTGASSDDTQFLDEIKGDSNILAECMDITVDSHVTRVFQAAIERFGTIDVIVNNAGMRQRDLYPPHGSATALETEVGGWQRMFDTHVFGTRPLATSRRRVSLDVPVTMIFAASACFDAMRQHSPC